MTEPAARLRMAVSPAGPLHVGPARIVLANWLLARRLGGHVSLRVEDGDPGRDTADAQAALRHDLSWLGLDWHEQTSQAAQSERYARAAEALKAAGRL